MINKNGVFLTSSSKIVWTIWMISDDSGYYVLFSIVDRATLSSVRTATKFLDSSN